MGVSPYILSKLYENGIIGYIPDLGPEVMGGMTAMQNPYMNMAMSGAGFQNYGSGRDSFTMSARPAIYTNSIGAQSQAPSNMFGFHGIGANTNTGISNIYGQSGIGTDTNTGISNLYNQGGIGQQTNTGIASSYGGFTDISNRVQGVGARFMNAPDIVKGIAALGIMVATFLLLKGKKKPKPKQGFFSRLNPFKKKVQPEPEKVGFWSRINPFKSKKTKK